MKLPILCYHKVGPEEREGRWLNISPARLRSHVRFFSRRGFEFVLPKDLSRHWPERGVAFTFDDAYQSALTEALPIFAYCGVHGRASFYAVSSLIGGMSQWDGDRARHLADWNLLKEARDLGFEIGNHTATHLRLDELDPDRQQEEVDRCHQNLLQQGFEISSFCYPFGRMNQHSTEIIRRRYPVGLALGKRPATPQDPLVALPRIVVAYSDALPKLLYKLHIRPLLP